jgi:hypothetical protein
MNVFTLRSNVFSPRRQLSCAVASLCQMQTGALQPRHLTCRHMRSRCICRAVQKEVSEVSASRNSEYDQALQQSQSTVFCGSLAPMCVQVYGQGCLFLSRYVPVWAYWRVHAFPGPMPFLRCLHGVNAPEIGIGMPCEFSMRFFL